MKQASMLLAVLLATLSLVNVGHAQNYVRDGFGKCLHIPQESWKNGIQLRTWDCLDKTHIKWQKVPLLIDLSQRTTADGNLQFFWLKNNMTGKCAAVHKGQKHDGAWVVQWDCESRIHFQWAEQDGQLIHRESKKCMHSASASNYATVTIMTCTGAQIPEGKHWKEVPLKVGDNKVLMNGFRNCLHVPYLSHKNGTQLMTWDCNENLEQLQWKITHPFTTVEPSYWFRNIMSDKCMAVHAGQKQDGAAVIQWDCGSGEHFQWKFLDLLQGGQHLGGQLRHQASGKCLQVASAGKRVPATLGPCVGLKVPSSMKWAITN